MKVLPSMFVAVLAFASASAFADAPVGFPLPQVTADAPFPLEKALKVRRSTRALKEAPVSLNALARLVWAAQGVTDDKGHRTTPSARATYPLDVYVVAGAVSGLPAGIYRYLPAFHSLELVMAGDRRKDLVEAAIGQAWVAKAPVSLVITATPERAREKMKEGAARFAPVEAGAAAQNILLEEVALGLGGTYVGGFNPASLRAFLRLPEGTEPWAVVPAGVPE